MQDAQKVKEALDKQGYVVLRERFHPKVIEALSDQFVQLYSEYLSPSPPQDALFVGIKRLQVTVEVAGAFNDLRLYADELVLATMTQLLGSRLVISDITCVVSLPGAPEMGIHCDGRIFEQLPIANLLPPHAIGLLIPLVSFNHLTGTTRVWPGTHRKQHTQSPSEMAEGYIDPEFEPGDCMLMDYRLMHQGNANRSDIVRPLLYVNYAAPWYFDSNNFTKQVQLSMTEEEFLRVPGEFQSLFARRGLMMASARVPRSP